MTRRQVSSLETVVFVVVSLLSGSYCKCPDYVFVQEENYERNFSAITTVGARPLGFMKGTWYYNQDQPKPCTTVSGADKRKLEIMAEAIPAARLCVSLNGAQQTCSDPGTGRLYQCVPGTENDNVEFTGTTGAEADIQFWYRLTLGSESDNEDTWCSGRDTEQFPTSLKSLPANYPLNTETDVSHNASAPKGLSLILSVLFLATICNLTVL
ncbi:hypothetical protein Bpfe_006389 [Biomphalaria pfeifferi]|uniref:Uncharacterized protein n=1 Tax=Biomphalaria pfeifferi TaxID=112525 RepID=A0AAD8FIB9_BIOPF|nr:hypothetical protein Bpfe_006389 [Biomphalaria pfeifferi]